MPWLNGKNIIQNIFIMTIQYWVVHQILGISKISSSCSLKWIFRLFDMIVPRAFIIKRNHRCWTSKILNLILFQIQNLKRIPIIPIMTLTVVVLHIKIQSLNVWSYVCRHWVAWDIPGIVHSMIIVQKDVG